jgi:hypothetical protein
MVKIVAVFAPISPSSQRVAARVERPERNPLPVPDHEAVG